MELRNKITIMITFFVRWKDFNPIQGNLNEENLEKLVGVLFSLDKAKELHFDLKSENIKINENSKKCILDFGQSTEFHITYFEEKVNIFNFPELECPTNLRNFEDTFLSPYLSELSKRDKGDSLNLFIFYERIKGKFHEMRGTYLEEFLSKHPHSATDNDTRHIINRIIDYESFLSRVFH